jgi:hypothetical protein
MKTITEFSGVLLKQAARVRAEKSAAGIADEGLAGAVTGESLGGERAAPCSTRWAAGDRLDVRLVQVIQASSAPR